MRSRGVLDRPVKPGDDSFDCGGRLTKPQFLPRSEATKQSSFLCCRTKLDCFAALAMTETKKGRDHSRPFVGFVRALELPLRTIRIRGHLTYVGWLMQRQFLRHCEPTGRANARPMTGSAKQSILFASRTIWIASAFALRATADAVVASAPRKKLALGKAAATIKTVVARLDRAIQYAAASHLSQTSLEYWVARSSRAMTAVFVSFIRVGPKAGTELAMTGLYSTPDISAALPPAAAVLTVTVCSVAKRAR